ncbi:ISAs1 family transposase [Pontiellaceae bacterium B12227]|nr:ISAs1 family transposase [Pontiellaceae bacterium B12227]
MKKSIQMPDSREQQILEGLEIRLVRNDEQACYERFIEEQHYLKSAPLVGEQLRYVAEYKGEWMALLSWNAGSYHLADRDGWIGWSDAQRRVRLPFVANNSRFLILEGKGCPNLASRAMKLCLQRLSDDWKAAYGHGILVAESFVDPQLFRGTAYKACGWMLLGKTKGYARARREYYTEHNAPKELYVRTLRPDSLELLRAEQMPAAWRGGELEPRVRCRTKAADLGSIRGIFEGIEDYRTGTNWSYTISGLLTLVFCATLAGMSSGQRDLAEYARDLSQGQLRVLGFRRNRKTGRIPAPGETTFFRLLKQIPPEKLQEKLLACLDLLLGPAAPRLIIIDGKELRGSQGLQLVSAFCGETGRFLGARAVEEKSNEIPAAPELIKECAKDGAMLLVDALHSQNKLARTSVQECGVDYFMTVKKNQPALRETLRTTRESHRESFSP